MAILDIYVDESGNMNLHEDFKGKYYCLSLVFHSKNNEIEKLCSLLDFKLSDAKCFAPFIHTMPLIRQDRPFENYTRLERLEIFHIFADFVRHLDIKYKFIAFSKHRYQNNEQLLKAMTSTINTFIDDNIEYFCSFDRIVIYYDRGQRIVSELLKSTFEQRFLYFTELRLALQKDYRLLQVADYICTMELIRLRWEAIGATKSELGFFGSYKLFKKNYFGKLEKKRFDDSADILYEEEPSYSVLSVNQ